MISWLKLAPYIGGAVVLLFLFTMVYFYIREEVLEGVEKENRNAADQAQEWRSNRSDCVAAGGVYHFESGKCSRP